MKRTLVLLLLVACGPTAAKKSPTTSTTTSSDDSEASEPTAEARPILDAHNRFRADHCAPPLEWSDKLAAAAQDWANQLRDAGCAFEHSQSSYGENLAGGSTGYLPPEDAVAMWYREIDGYDFGGGGFSMETGHFTQLVWRDTRRLGCGMSQCNGMDIWVCEYDPPGNVEGEYREQVLPTGCD
jgi:hypothetical protein